MAAPRVRVSRKPQLVTTYPPIESSEITTSTARTSSGTRIASETPGRSRVSRLNHSKNPTACSSWLAAPSAAAAITTPLPVSGANRTHEGSKVTTSRSGDPAATSSSAVEVRSSSSRSARARSSGSPSRSMRSSSLVEAVPVPIRTLVSPSRRWIGDEVRSTVRTRSTGVESTCRLSSPRWSSIRPPLIRKLVVR